MSTNTVGSVGILHDVIEFPGTIANLISTGKLLEDERWEKFEILKSGNNGNKSQEQYWWGIMRNGNRVLLGIRKRDSKHSLFEATTWITQPPNIHAASSTLALTATPGVKPRHGLRRSRLDLQPLNLYGNHYIALGLPNVNALEIIDKHFDKPIFGEKGRKEIKKMAARIIPHGEANEKSIQKKEEKR